MSEEAKTNGTGKQEVKEPAKNKSFFKYLVLIISRLFAGILGGIAGLLIAIVAIGILCILACLITGICGCIVTLLTVIWVTLMCLGAVLAIAAIFTCIVLGIGAGLFPDLVDRIKEDS